MPYSDVIPAWMIRNKEAEKSLREEFEQRVIPGTEDWVPEDETEDASFMDELGRGDRTSTIWRIVNEHGEVERSNHSTALNKPYYATLRGAKSALAYARNRLGRTVRLQKGEVSWEEL